MAFTLKHTQLGDIQGSKLDDQGVVQYLGIQYATLAHRFAGPELKNDYGGNIDATRRGPTVVRPPLACDIEFGLIQKALDKPDDRPMSDLDGLTLDITVPEAALNESNAKLPVLVFIHGGAYIIGDSGAPHYDMAAIVAYAQSIGKPIIGVAINYRLGVAGFLDSSELRAAGIPPNRGILDQKTAFQWVRQNIGGFCGDPTRITAIGQSAGGSSIMHLLDLDLQQNKSLFERAICLSGNNLAVPSSTERVAQDAYKSVLQCLGIDSALPSQDQLKALIATSPGDILSKIPMSVPLQPVIETDQLPSFRSLESHLPSAQHRPPLMIGSTDFDAVVFEVLGLFADRDPGLAQGFARSLIKAIPEAHHARLDSLLSLYGIPETENDDEARIKILQFGTDLKYFATSRHYANFWPSQSWLYYFNEANPWDGPHKGRSAHCLDIAYLFLNFNHVMDDSQKKTATDFARDVISFTNLEEPWAEFHASKELRVYGVSPDSQTLEGNAKITPGPSVEVQRIWSEIGLDNLTQAWGAYSARS